MYEPVVHLRKHKTTTGFVGIGARLHLTVKQNKKKVIQEIVIIAASHEALAKMTKRLDRELTLSKRLCRGCQVIPVNKELYAKLTSPPPN